MLVGKKQLPLWSLGSLETPDNNINFLNKISFYFKQMQFYSVY